MGRLMAIDFGRKRCGIAVTDTLRIVANGLTTVPTASLPEFVADYCRREPVDAIIVGEPRDMRGNPSESQRFITPALARLKKTVPDGGLSKMARRDKALVDEISATILLNDYLQSQNI